jgi:hypothetical protein
MRVSGPRDPGSTGLSSVSGRRDRCFPEEPLMLVTREKQSRGRLGETSPIPRCPPRLVPHTVVTPNRRGYADGENVDGVLATEQAAPRAEWRGVLRAADRIYRRSRLPSRHRRHADKFGARRVLLRCLIAVTVSRLLACGSGCCLSEFIERRRDT